MAIASPLSTLTRPTAVQPPRTPEGARRAALRALIESTGVSAAALVRLAVASAGSPQVVDRLIEGRGLSRQRLSGLEARLLRSGGRPPRRHVDAFAPCLPRAVDRVSCAWAAITAQGRVLGLVAVAREPGQPALDGRALRTLNRAIPRLGRALAAAEERERESLSEAPFHVILSTRGDVLMATPEAQDWLAHGGKRALEGAVAEAADEAIARATVAFGGGAEITLRVMTGLSDVALLATVSRTSPLRLAPDHQLTPRQREVADFAAAGATAPEIARTLDISVNTVKHHLKEVYRVFEVASRVELRDVLTARDA